MLLRRLSFSSSHDMSTIAVIAAGAMGSNVGRKFVEAGYTVLTSLEGRSDATRKRAEEAGMIDADLPSIIKKADILLSIIPPKDAIAFAERFLREYESAEMIKSEPIVFVDCNAVNVDTLRRMGTLFAATKIPFLDACIIGGPPSGSYVPTFYACADPKHGDALQEFQATVGRAGIKIRILGGQESGIGNASALKMSYAVSVEWYAKCWPAALTIEEISNSVGFVKGSNWIVYDHHTGSVFPPLSGTKQRLILKHETKLLMQIPRKLVTLSCRSSAILNLNFWHG